MDGKTQAMYNTLSYRRDQYQAYKNLSIIATGPLPISKELRVEYETRLRAIHHIQIVQIVIYI